MEGHRNCRMLGYDKCKEYHLIRSRPSGSQRANQQNCPKLPARIWPTSEVSQVGCFLPPDQHIPGDGVRGLPITIVFGLMELQQWCQQISSIEAHQYGECGQAG
ncbi:uncharacterized protein LOC134204139 [Armigeres subalbatus]|uniref:uncharacterized protein LOC134204139 n=1 Tax=Armigeres subalbatus TaxID=124917 RepID=UPI002ED44208